MPVFLTDAKVALEWNELLSLGSACRDVFYGLAELDVSTLGAQVKIYIQVFALWLGLVKHGVGPFQCIRTSRRRSQLAYFWL